MKTDEDGSLAFALGLLVLTFTAVPCVLLVALVLGWSWRIFAWAAGL